MTATVNKPLTGRRKTAVARVRLLPGSGTYTINDRTPIDYLKRETLVQEDASLVGALGRAGLLTRDSRMKERKKYGQPGARKRFQFSKR